MRVRPIAVAMVALALSLMATPGSHAQPRGKRALAKEAWTRGQALYDAKRYHQAMAQFQRGYDATRTPAFLFNMAECRRMLRDRAGARSLYRRYLCEKSKVKNRASVVAVCESLGLGPCTPQCAPKPATPKPATSRPATSRPASSQPVSPGIGNAAGPAATESSGPSQATPGRLAAVPPSTATSKPYLPTAATEAEPATSRPFYTHWGFWTGVGAVMIAGSVTAIVLATRSSDHSPSLTLDFR